MPLSSTSFTKAPPNPPTASSDGNQSSDRERNNKFQIFLGGSCNPTTWRQAVAIPYLEMNGISYYNPQVDNWTPDVVKTERDAKQSAQVLLFVIDKQTRSTVSLVESAYMAGDSKNLVLVMYPFYFDALSISDTINETTSSMIETRRELTKTNLKESSENRVTSSSYAKSSSTSSSNSTTISSTEKHASATMRMNNETISLEEFLELRRARIILQTLIAKQNTPIFYDIPQALHYVSEFLDFDETDSPKQKTPVGGLVCQKDQRTMNTDGGTRRDFDKSDQFTRKKTDIYLSLDDHGDSDIESTLLFMLREKGLTYHYRPLKCIADLKQTNNTLVELGEKSLSLNTEKNELQRYSDALEEPDRASTELALEREMDTIHGSRVLLFVITNRCRGLSIMVLASHFMALFRNNVVLCIQYLEQPCSIDGETLTENAIADYNRGRVYLCDYAVKSKVPVFKTISEAVDCCIQKCAHGRLNKT